ncbi:MAG: hypothetical protein ACOCYG_04695, partial [Spirochaetota bacterium]
WRRARERYERLLFVDDHASAAQTEPDVIPNVDVYFKKQLLADRSRYADPIYGKRLYTDHYHHAEGIRDTEEVVLRGLTEEEIAKLRPLWNLGIGLFPKSRIRAGLLRRLEPAVGVAAARLLSHPPRRGRVSSERTPRIQARFSSNFDRETVAIHRRRFAEQAGRHPETFLTGKVDQRTYNREVYDVAGVASPFGWGEVCFRDFEAIIGGATLIKPEMSHVETWPDVFRPGETYLPVDWNAERLPEVAEWVLSHPGEARSIAERAREVFFGAYTDLESRLDSLFAELRG